MITVVKQYLNAIFMYVYLYYYRRKLRKSFSYMVQQSFEHRADLNDR